MNLFQKIKKEIPTVLFAALLIILIIVTTVSLRGYAAELGGKYIAIAQNYSKLQSAALENAGAGFLADAANLARMLPEDVALAGDFLTKSIFFADSDIETIRYFSNGDEYDHGGELFSRESAELLALADAGESALSGVIYDPTLEKSCVAVFMPTNSHDDIDGLLVFFKLSALSNRLAPLLGQRQDSVVFQGLCSADGTIVFDFFNDESTFPLVQNENFFLRLHSLTNDKNLSDDFEREVKRKRDQAVAAQISGETYFITSGAPEIVTGRWFFVEIFDYARLSSAEKSLIATFGSLLIFISLILVAFLVYIILHKIRSARFLDETISVDPNLGCPNLHSFLRDSEPILARNKVTKFAFVYIKIKRFEYIEENFGDIAAVDALRFVAKVLHRILQLDETYAHLGGEQFVALFHYQQIDGLLERLNTINGIIANYPALKEFNYSMKTGIGVYEAERDKGYSIQKMLDRAVITQRVTSVGANANIGVYDGKIEARIRHEAEFEAKMYNSLKKGEFLNFYQPKYNLAQKRIEGCEALVRWYDPQMERYREPGEFLPFFEANGSISDLDRYVFAEACKFISSSTAKGYKMVPISVNVSRVTATQKGFAEYYISTKKKYKIADNFLTIEFTESFAFENYDVLKDVVIKLQENGFLCSIDDFGSGYSSYNVLKELVMDELKLDKFFITTGLSEERDDMLLKSIITMAKSMGMKVTQEGVETKEELQKLKAFGCDVVQGYLYSVPLNAEKYISFIQLNPSL